MEWRFADSFIECESCNELYDGKPPCADCRTPELLKTQGGYGLAIECWRDLSFYSRPAGFGGLMPIALSEMIAYIEAIGGDFELLEQVQWIEGYAYPVLTSQSDKEGRKNESK